MKLISHRGNIINPDKQYENHPDYIMQACGKGFDVEIDVWSIKDKFYLGHDEPEYEVGWKFLVNQSFWCHAKNFQALLAMKKCGAHYFWHEEDQYTLTSNGFVWTYPGKLVGPESIIVCTTLEETKNIAMSSLYGICSDFVGALK